MENSPLILIVDDEPFNVDFLEQELDDLGYQTLSAQDGLKALEIVRTGTIDLVLLDIMMPLMDGFEVLTKMKADEVLQHIPVIVISAMSDMNSIVRGIELGAEDFLPKPFDEVLLQARIGSALEKKKLRDLEQTHLQSLEKELEIGHQIQTGFLPEFLPALPGWSLEVFFKPAREVAGDFYDAFLLPDGNLALILGDVADKGVGSALFMALYRSLLRSGLNNRMLLDNPAEKLIRALTHTNEYVCGTHGDALFVTLFAAILDIDTGELAYINAGHNPPMWISSGKRDLLSTTGPALGIIPGIQLTAKSRVVLPGDRLFVFSDGLEDAKNPSGALFGDQALHEALSQENITVNEVIKDIQMFMDGADQYDDLTLLNLVRD